MLHSYFHGVTSTPKMELKFYVQENSFLGVIVTPNLSCSFRQCLKINVETHASFLVMHCSLFLWFRMVIYAVYVACDAFT